MHFAIDRRIETARGLELLVTAVAGVGLGDGQDVSFFVVGERDEIADSLNIRFELLTPMGPSGAPWLCLLSRPIRPTTMSTSPAGRLTPSPAAP